jgi:hypothetical protein
MINGKINQPVTLTSSISGEWRQTEGPEEVNLGVSFDQKSAVFTPSKNGLYRFTHSNESFDVTVGTVAPEPAPEPKPPVPEPEPPAPEPTGNVLYDSLIHSTLHDGKEETFTKIGSISPNGLGLECRASGNPRIRKNPDKTFSLLCDAGHGRFYGYVINYNATLEIECAFWNQAAGQDCSIKIRSRHNEGGAEDNRFGGYGFTVDRQGWGSKVEQFHNEHSESVSGSLPSKPETQKYFKVEFTAKDEGSKVRLIAKYNGTQVMSRLVKKYQDLALFMKQSYLWIRSNIDSGTGELRIKRLRMLKA